MGSTAFLVFPCPNVLLIFPDFLWVFYLLFYFLYMISG